MVTSGHWIRNAIVFTAIALAAGCGESLEVVVYNYESGLPIEVELLNRWNEGDEARPWLRATIAPNSAFEYRMEDGWRSAGKLVRTCVGGDDEGRTAAVSELRARTSIEVRLTEDGRLEHVPPPIR